MLMSKTNVLCFVLEIPLCNFPSQQVWCSVPCERIVERAYCIRVCAFALNSLHISLTMKLKRAFANTLIRKPWRRIFFRSRWEPVIQTNESTMVVWTLKAGIFHISGSKIDQIVKETSICCHIGRGIKYHSNSVRVVCPRLLFQTAFLVCFSNINSYVKSKCWFQWRIQSRKRLLLKFITLLDFSESQNVGFVSQNEYFWRLPIIPEDVRIFPKAFQTLSSHNNSSWLPNSIVANCRFSSDIIIFQS